ncbi:MAG: hypothetical protein AAFU85_30300 [Planctomycetota bacterium]
MPKEDIFENVTTTTGEDIKRFLRSNQSVGYLSFPSLERLTSKSSAYNAADYATSLTASVWIV